MSPAADRTPKEDSSALNDEDRRGLAAVYRLLASIGRRARLAAEAEAEAQQPQAAPPSPIKVRRRNSTTLG